jgi:7-cyano-7-deazaguanine synthase
VLLGALLREGHRVQPFYVRSQLAWEREELCSVRRFLAAVGREAGERLRDLVVLDMPVADLLADHWSVTGREVPAADSPDEAVYLPGRNLLLLTKVAVWCHLHGIARLALGVLGSNPFADASDAFFESFQAVLNRGLGGQLAIVRPFAAMSKREVIELGRGMPLELTFSCIAPRDGLHCGRCNKCAERQEAFRAIRLADPTRYAERSSPVP